MTCYFTFFMTLIKQSFKHTIANRAQKPVSSPGTEFAGITKNNQKNYAKTGQWRVSKPLVTEKCVGCGICAQNCPEAVIEMKVASGKKRAMIDYNYCKGCGLCSEVCALKAIKME